MDFLLTTLQQVAVMFILILIGVFCYKAKFITKVGSSQITSLLLYIVNPLVIINAYQIPFQKQLAKNLFIAFILGITSHLIAMIIAYIFVRKKSSINSTNLTKEQEKINKHNLRVPVERFAVIYTNCGFMALPLIFALFKSEGVFYASAYLAIFSILSWTHGYMGMSGKSDKQAFKKACLSPVVISTVLGLVLFFANLKLPFVIASGVSAMASLNTPLAMIVTGISLAQSNIKQAFKNKRCYYIVFLINIVVPLVALVCYVFLPIDQNIVLVNLISTACPCAVTTLLFATKFERDPSYASNLLTLSNVVCIATIPMIMLLHTLISV